MELRSDVMSTPFIPLEASIKMTTTKYCYSRPKEIKLFVPNMTEIKTKNNKCLKLI